jgi:L-asparaginase II
MLVEVTRGPTVESRHAIDVAVVDADGALVWSSGDPDAAVFPRSAVKSMLALPMVESGAADRLGLTEAEIALACSSHSGERVHTQGAASMLAKAGRDVTCLACGVHWPTHEPTARALANAGGQPTALHNNCSGKHAGFICLACDRGLDPAGYETPDHPAMREITAALAAMTGAVLDERNRAVDGCSIPTFAIPLRAQALGFARVATGAGQAPERAKALARIRAAVAANPIMVGGTGKFDTEVMTAMGARIFSKGGAEGVHAMALPEQGLGIVVKARDGAGRAGNVAVATLAARFLRDADNVLAQFMRPTLRNWRGIEVGEMRVAA